MIHGHRTLTFLLLMLGSLDATEPDKWQEAIQQAERLHEQRRLEQAGALLLGALNDVSAHPDEQYRFAYTLDNLGSVAQDQGRYFEAASYYRRSIAHWQAAGERWRGGLARTQNNLASLLYGAGKFREAEELLERAQAIAVERARGDDPDLVILMNNGMMHLRQGRFQQAEGSYRLAWAILAPQRDSRELEFARLAHHLGVLYEATGRKKEAKAYFATAQQSWEEQVQRGAPPTEALVGLAAVYSDAGQAIPALRLLEKALPIAERELGAGHLRSAEILFFYAKLLRRTKQKTEAALIEKQAEAIRAGSQESLARYTITLDELGKEKRSK